MSYCSFLFFFAGVRKKKKKAKCFCKVHYCGREQASCSDPAQLFHSNLKGSLYSTLHTEWNTVLKIQKHPPLCAQIAVFSRRQAGVNQSLLRTDRQWLHSNLWGGSVTVLFLALHSRVSVSCGSYQLPGLMIGPQPSHPPVPAAVFQFSCPH